MWYLTFLLIIGSVIADHHHAWETGNEYHFLMQSRTLTALNELAAQYSGILMKGDLTVQVKSSDTLQAVVSKTLYAPVHKILPEGWDSEIIDLGFHELSLSGKPFEIKLKNGLIQDMLIDQDVPTWEVNLLKSIISQLQIDTQGENMITSKVTQIPNDDQPFGTFKAMEDSVGGKCEVLYNITPLPEDEAELVPLPNLRKDGHHIDITKTKNYTGCEQQMGYHSGIFGKMNWKPGFNEKLLSRSSTSRILISGNLRRFTIQSSVTTNEIFISSKIHDTYSGAVYSRVSLTLDRMSKISNLIMPASNNLVSTGNLVYIYNNPFSNERKPRRSSVRSSLAAEFENHNSNNSSKESRNVDDSSSSNSFNSEERDYLQPKPKLDEPPESPLLPYFVGYKGKSIQKSGVNLTAVAVRMIYSIIDSSNIDLPPDLKSPRTDILEQFTMLIRLIRTMDVKQITEIENQLPKILDNNKNPEEEKNSYNQIVWNVLSNAVAHAGTGPALITIKNWIKSKKLEGREAVNIISRIPKTALTPTTEYVNAFFELITDEQVRKQKFLNTTAPLSFAELIRYTQSCKSCIYPVYSFGRIGTSKHDNALLETYISYMATQLKEAIEEHDSPRIQTYIMALGNFGHPKILSVFEPYLFGGSSMLVSKFQRLMMVISLHKLSENFPRIARSVAYRIYVNEKEAYELRCAAVYVIMRTNPPLSMLQRMAEFTNHDQDKHVNSVVKTNIDTLANLVQPELQDLANKASIAKKQLNPDIDDTENYSQSSREAYIATLNIIQTSIFQTIGSDDSVIPKGVYLDIHQSWNGFNLPSSRLTYSISSIKELLIYIRDQLPWLNVNKAEKKSIIEETIEKLGITPEDAELIEGNIFMDTIFVSEFYPFDNHTLEDMINMLTTYAMSFKSPEILKFLSMYYLYNYDMTLGFPTESGLPFVYTLSIPKLTHITSEQFHTVKNSSTERFMEILAGRILLSEKIQSRIGFVTPFEHRHYIAGIDVNTRIFLPAGLSVKSEGRKFELKINENNQYGNEQLMIHHSIVPYTARHDILSFEHGVSEYLNNDTRLVTTKEPHTIEFPLENAIFHIESDHIDNGIKKKGMEAASEIYNIFSNNDAHYRKFDAILLLTAAHINISFDYRLMFDVNSSEATIPSNIDKRPDSEERREQFIREVSKDVNAATSYAYDISVRTAYNQYVFTLAVADSYVDKSQALWYWNSQSPNNEKVFEEFCAIGYVQPPRNTPLNFEKAIEEIPNYEFKAEMRFENCANGQSVRLKGNWTRTDDVKEMAMKSEIVEKCQQEIKQGNVWLPTCQKASKLIRQKNYLMMSIDMDSELLYMFTSGVVFRLISSVSKDTVMNSNSGNINKNTINMELKMPSDNEKNVNISVHTLEMDITFSLINIYQEKLNILKKSLEEEEDSTEDEHICVLDKTQVVTFDEKVYPLTLGNCWHVMMTTYPKRDPNNPEKTLNIPKYMRMMVMAREMDDGSKQIRIILDNQEIYLQKSNNYLEVMVDGQVANFSNYGGYREDTFEIYRLNGIIVIFSLEYENYVAYDGERILLRSSDKYLNAVRGLCGNYDKRSDNDFIIPKNCILTNPEEFAATYALTQEENCQGPALQNKRKAEQSTCIPRSYHLNTYRPHRLELSLYHG